MQRLQQSMGLLAARLPGTVSNNSPVLFQEAPWVPLNPVPLDLLAANIAVLQAQQKLLDQQYLSSAATLFPSSLYLDAAPLSSQAAIQQRVQLPAATGSLDQHSTHSRGSNSTQNNKEPASPSAPLKRPKRALTSYNLFFKSRREQLLAKQEQQAAALLIDSKHNNSSNQTEARPQKRPQIGFEEMGKIIGKEWKEIDPQTLAAYEAEAQKDKERYQKELAIYKASRNAAMEAKLAAMERSVPDEVRQRYFAEASRRKKRKTQR